MKQEEKWNMMYLLLLKYKKENGNVEVPESFIGNNGEKLGIWVSTQRTRFKSNKLSEGRVNKLKEIGFRFEKTDFDEIWNDMYLLLEEYKKEHGNTEVPFKYVTSSGKNLGTWVNIQRSMYKINKLSEGRVDKLKEIGFRFENINPIVKFETKWEYMYSLLEEYKIKYGDTDVPKDYRAPSGENLGTWASTQKVMYRNNKLSEGRIKKLKELEFRFEKKDPNVIWETKWEYMYSLLEEYKIKYGNTDISRNYKTPSGENLGTWTNTQRGKYKNNKLSESRINKLKEIGFRFENINPNEKYEEKWNYMYSLLIEYKKKNGDTEVPDGFITAGGENLGTWVNTQRFMYKNNNLSEGRIKKLKEIEFRFENANLDEIWDNKWEYMYSLLIKYKLRYGDTDVSRDYKTVSGENLGFWVNRQRYMHRINKLTAVREEKLRLLGFRFYNIDEYITDSEDSSVIKGSKPFVKIKRR